jgi:hypothetical protein
LISDQQCIAVWPAQLNGRCQNVAMLATQSST